MGIWRKLFRGDQIATDPSQTQDPLEFRQEKNAKGEDSANKTKKEDLPMQNELITSENLSPELLKSVFDAAFMDTTLDDDGGITVHDAYQCWVKANMKSKEMIQFIGIFNFREDSKPLDRLECVNRINNEYLMIRAFVYEKLLILGYDFWIVGGITKKALVSALKRFTIIQHSAVVDHGQGIVK